MNNSYEEIKTIIEAGDSKKLLPSPVKKIIEKRKKQQDSLKERTSLK